MNKLQQLMKLAAEQQQRERISTNAHVVRQVMRAKDATFPNSKFSVEIPAHILRAQRLAAKFREKWKLPDGVRVCWKVEITYFDSIDIADIDNATIIDIKTSRVDADADDAILASVESLLGIGSGECGGSGGGLSLTQNAELNTSDLISDDDYSFDGACDDFRG